MLIQSKGVRLYNSNNIVEISWVVLGQFQAPGMQVWSLTHTQTS